VVAAAQPIVVRARPEDRLRNLVLLGTLVVWMVYTRLYSVLHPVHATLPVCPFLQITGHPCPFCGGTRSFAYVWNGDLAHAVRLYPLGPVMFVATMVAIPVLLGALLTQRDIRIPGPVFRVGAALGVVALAVSWALKLTVLPN
jgi:Protein of unknown function (DUF2752)